jgi:hypothetical protein
MRERIFLLLVGWCMAVVAWQTFTYPPDYLTAAWVWASVASIAALAALLAVVSPARGFAVAAGAALICHSIGRSGGLVIQIVFRERFAASAPFANYAVAATTWALVALLSLQAWSHYVLPWSASRKVLH